MKLVRQFVKNIHRFHPYEGSPNTITVATARSPVNTNGCNDQNGNGIDGGDLLVPGWKERYASDSEAIVKAERHGMDSTEELQKQTVEHWEKYEMQKQQRRVIRKQEQECKEQKD